MSPLEAARHLAENNGQALIWDNEGGHFGCDLCATDDGKHAPDCPWLAMPKIVAALQAAESVAATVDGSRFISTLGATVRAIHKLQDAMWDELDEAKG